MGILIERAERLNKLPPYLFAEIDRAKRKSIQDGKDVIDLGVGDPDMPTFPHIIKEMAKAIQEPRNHRYALDSGMPELRESIARWYKNRFSVQLDPAAEILPLIGSKEGIAHLPLAFVNQGEIVLVPDPCYPPNKSGTIFAGGEPYLMPLSEKNGFLPDLEEIEPQIARKARLIFLNYPNNPTAAVADSAFFENVVDFAFNNNIIVCHDAAYSEISYDGYKPVSFLEIEGAKEVGIEFHSLSKTFNMTGWRIGFACGNAQVIGALASVKSNIDSGIFQAIQCAGIAALNNSSGELLGQLSSMYQERRDVLVDGLNSLGWKVTKPKATFYVWFSVPSGWTSTSFSKLLLEKANLIVTPGVGFGNNGEGYIRMALTVSKERIKEAIGRLKAIRI